MEGMASERKMISRSPMGLVRCSADCRMWAERRIICLIDYDIIVVGLGGRKLLPLSTITISRSIQKACQSPELVGLGQDDNRR